MRFIQLVVLSTSTTLLTLANAQTLTKSYQALSTLSIASDFVQKGRAQSLSILPPFSNHYTNMNGSATTADAGGFLGVEKPVNKRLLVQLGIAAYIDAQISPLGHVWEFESPTFDTFAYSYSIQHRRIMAEGKLLTTLEDYEKIHPYLSWGLGAAINNAKNYHVTPLVAGALSTNVFSNNKKTAFTWGVGLGADYSINSKMRIGLGYQFLDLGAVSLGPVIGAVSTQALNLNHLYVNQVRFQFTTLI